MVSEKVMEIQTTFTYNETTDEICWLNPNMHKVPKPRIYRKKLHGFNYEYCNGRGGKPYRVSLIKGTLGGQHE